MDESTEKKVIGMFGDPKGDVSSKRVTSFICFATAIVIAFTTKDVAMAGVFAGAGLALQGITAWSEKGMP